MGLPLTYSPMAASRIAKRASNVYVALRDAAHKIPLEAFTDELERAGLIDDARLAASLVGSLRRRGGAGRRLMEQKLRARKIGREVSDAAIEGALAGVDPYEEALALARGRAARMKSDTDRAARTRRLHGFLARRGYEGDVCWRVVREVVGGDAGDG